MRSRTALLVVLLAALALPAGAAAGGGRYAFDGGTPSERAQVRAALEASSFDWNVVPARIVIHVRRGIASEATPGQVWLDAGLVDTGSFAWGVVQHEYAHQIDYFVLTDADRAAIQSLLGGDAWCGGEPATHDDNTCERFATAVAWAYWPSARNAFDPSNCTDETWLRANPLRGLLATILGVRNPFRALTLR
jgi:hypothetical protein